MIMHGGNIFNEFRHGVFYEEIYKKYGITEEQLIFILQRNIKGKYDYKRILSGGMEAQKQFNKHLSNRWNPLDPDAPWEPIPPYLEPDYNRKLKNQNNLMTNK